LPDFCAANRWAQAEYFSPATIPASRSFSPEQRTLAQENDSSVEADFPSRPGSRYNIGFRVRITFLWSLNEAVSLAGVRVVALSNLYGLRRHFPPHHYSESSSVSQPEGRPHRGVD
jgi:hypothetical protein